MRWTITDSWCVMRSVTVRRPADSIRATIQLPRSKSVANRALVLAALAGDLEVVRDPGDGDDTRILLQLLKERPRVMHCGLGGTTFRFLLAWACVQEGEEHVITGDPHLLQRPHDVLVDALIALGADITRTDAGFLVRGRRMQGGAIIIRSALSSQYISALLLIAPTFAEGLQLTWSGKRLSAPYVAMTLRLLEHFGVKPEERGELIHVPASVVQRSSFTVPPDWSAAAFWFEVVALAPGSEVLLKGLFVDPLQGDREAARLWSPWVRCTDTQEGLLLHHREAPGPWTDALLDMQQVPDLFQALAFTLAARGIPSRFTGLDNLPLKETDRLKAVADVLHALGVQAGHSDGMFRQEGRINASVPLVLDPRNDHRMAMSVGPLALVLPEVTVCDPAVVHKSYPGFWEDLGGAGFVLSLRA